jgi:hypothetical protein
LGTAFLADANETPPLGLKVMATLSELQFVEGAPALAPEDASSLIKRMRIMLSAIRPRSDAEALKLLRANFPDSTLGERLVALSRPR